MKQRCLGCMELYGMEFDVCPFCGYIRNTPPKEAYHIVPGMVLHDRYLVGRVLGSGGFGITYIGFDMTLNKKVAIKEYLPVEFATRVPNQKNVTVYAGEKYEQFTAGMEKSLDEAQRLAEFRQTPGITQIYDFFKENNTSYIVMELLEGETLKERLKRETKMTVEEALPIVLQVLDALQEVHSKSILHRDIAPDNIFLLKDGTVKLMDFGASRQVTTTHSKSLTVILKLGYAPIEQYQSGGNQGPWTDVYALAATFYRMITGKRPPEAQERRLHDTLKDPSKMGVVINKSMENALMNALHVKIEDRTQSAAEFKAALEASDTSRTKATPDPSPVVKWPLWLKLLCGGLAAVVVTLVILMATGVVQSPLSLIGGQLVSSENSVWVPYLVNMSQEEARQLTEERGLKFEVGGTEASETILKGYVLSQTDESGNRIGPGDEMEKGAVLKAIISSGSGMVSIPDLLWMNEDVAVKQLNDLGIIAVNTETDAGTWAPEGAVTGILADGETVDINGESDAQVKEDAVITLRIASGGQAAASDGEIVPDLSGMTQQDAYIQLKQSGLFLEKEAVEHRIDVPRGQIIGQNPAAGEAIGAEGIVKVTISTGPRKITVIAVDNMAQEEARQALEDLGLTVEMASDYSDTVENGRVMSQNIEAGTSVDEGSTITLTVSQGTRPVQETRAPVRNNNNTGGNNAPAPTQAPQTQAPTQAPPPETQAAPPETQAPQSDTSRNQAFDVLGQLGQE